MMKKQNNETTTKTTTKAIVAQETTLEKTDAEKKLWFPTTNTNLFMPDKITIDDFKSMVNYKIISTRKKVAESKPAYSTFLNALKALEVKPENTKLPLKEKTGIISADPGTYDFKDTASVWKAYDLFNQVKEYTDLLNRKDYIVAGQFYEKTLSFADRAYIDVFAHSNEKEVVLLFPAKTVEQTVLAIDGYRKNRELTTLRRELQKAFYECFSGKATFFKPVSIGKKNINSELLVDFAGTFTVRPKKTADNGLKYGHTMVESGKSRDKSLQKCRSLMTDLFSVCFISALNTLEIGKAPEKPSEKPEKATK